MSDDPFRYHPRLRALIRDPETSFFRDLDVEALIARHPDPNIRDMMLPDEVREAGRIELLANRRDEDLWVFAYGSLTWDPGILFTEVRRAFAPHHQRRFILKDTRGPRGSAERPGVMAALDEGDGCHGLAFRIAQDQIEEETRRLWQRERIGPAYREAMIEVELSDGTVEAVAFLADHASDMIVSDLSREDQIEYAATGEGFLGSSYDYINSIATGLETLGIEDPDLTDLLTAIRKRRAAA